MNRTRNGLTLLYGLVALAVLAGFVSMGVDLGRVQTAKSELQCAAESAARAGALALTNGSTAARNAAIAVAAQNTVDGTPMTITNSDIDIGNFANGTFTNNGTPTNSVRVHCSRTSARGNAVPLLFARALGRSTCDINTAATASVGEPSGFVALNGITVKNNAYIASYNPSQDTNPSQGSSKSNGGLVSNGPVDGKNNNDLYGTLILGPGGSVNGLTVHGSQKTLSANATAPTMPAWSPGSNPGGIGQNYTVNGNVTLTGGTYWFTSLTVNGALTFSSATTVYVNGNVALGGSLAPASALPSDLKIYQLNAGAFGDSTSNGMDLVANVVAPSATLTAKNNAKLRGSALFDTMTFKNNVDMYYDETGGAAGGGITLSQTK